MSLPLELNLENKNENGKIIEKEKDIDKKFYEDFINKKRKLYEDNYDKSEGNQKSGRKIKKSGKTGLHNKFSDDNLIKKIILMILNIMLDYCNNKISIIYRNIIGTGKDKKELLKIHSEGKKRAKVTLYKNLLNKSFKEIFSEKISEKYVKYDKNHNKNLIEKLLKEKDEAKRIKFENLFNLTFLDCLKHFTGIKYFPELNGMTLFEEACKKFEKDDDYQDYKIILEYYTKYFEEIIDNKKQRNRIQKKKNLQLKI